MDSTALIPVQYGLDTFYFLICGALVMWMAAGFSMLEAGLVRAKNTAEILTKNIVLYALASIMYLLIGGVGGVLVVFSILALDKLKLDDPVGAISVHGVVGMWGLLAVPLTNAEASFGAQLLGLVSIFAWVFVASLIVWGIIKAVMGLRVSEEEEYEGVDVVECGLEAYPEFTSKR